jgi:hypothetical protein
LTSNFDGGQLITARVQLLQGLLSIMTLKAESWALKWAKFNQYQKICKKNYTLLSQEPAILLYRAGGGNLIFLNTTFKGDSQ